MFLVTVISFTFTCNFIRSLLMRGGFCNFFCNMRLKNYKLRWSLPNTGLPSKVSNSVNDKSAKVHWCEENTEVGPVGGHVPEVI